ncbi:hypothetical protein DPMN_180746 [Dreissena polymorpha]|uniref:Uncharacterized protein n=1 Tax=Dreissena polymorpha TaxID=45954 RepID=A0A9D4DBG8_DREPO|nr:hypothetical protein DPMN_180746 [Dreissena polymorpha]
MVSCFNGLRFKLDFVRLEKLLFGLSNVQQRCRIVFLKAVRSLKLTEWLAGWLAVISVIS